MFYGSARTWTDRISDNIPPQMSPRTRVGKEPIIALYFEFETVLKFYNLGPDETPRISLIFMLKAQPTMNNYINKLPCWYIEQLGPLVYDHI